MPSRQDSGIQVTSEVLITLHVLMYTLRTTARCHHLVGFGGIDGISHRVGLDPTCSFIFVLKT